MSDERTIQERLRVGCWIDTGKPHEIDENEVDALMREAADRIDALEKALKLARPYVSSAALVPFVKTEEGILRREATYHVDALIDAALNPKEPT